MAEMLSEHAALVRRALRAIVSNPDYGADALSKPEVMSVVLKEALPDAPAEVELLLAAARSGLADELRELVSTGFDGGTTTKVAATSMKARTALSREECHWVADELAIAMGLSTGTRLWEPDGLPTICTVVPPGPREPVPAWVEELFASSNRPASDA